jgi:hypothetical protein
VLGEPVEGGAGHQPGDRYACWFEQEDGVDEAGVVDRDTAGKLDVDPEIAVGADLGAALDLDVGGAHVPFSPDLEVAMIVVCLGPVELELAVAGEGGDGSEQLLPGPSDLSV